MRALIKATDWADPRFNRTLQALQIRPVELHRKAWEYAVIAQALEDAGMLDAGKRGLGLGTGTELLCFHFANRAAHVVATDLFTQDTDWENARLKVEDAYTRSPFPYARERLEFKNMDMTKIDLPDRSVDFVWSTSSVEHVNDVEAYLQVFRGIDRVLVPGGVAAIVTEFNLRATPHYPFGLIMADAPLIRRVEEATQLRLAGELDLSVEDHPCNVPFNLDILDMVPFWRHLPNIWAMYKGSLFTSALLVFKKDPSLPMVAGTERVDQALVAKYEKIGQALRRHQVLDVRPEQKFTQCGVLRDVDGAPTLESNGKAGYLTYGPYIQLPAGRYRARMKLRARGLKTSGAAGYLKQQAGMLECEADVALNDPAVQGDLRVVAKSRVKLTGEDELSVDLPFETDERSCCEFRLVVPAVEGVQYRGTELQAI